MNNAATLAFHQAASMIIRNKPKGKSHGSRVLKECRNELASATIMGLKDREILSCFSKLGKLNPLAGLKPKTAIVYISQARCEMGYRKRPFANRSR